MSQDQGRVMGKCPQAWPKARGAELERGREGGGRRGWRGWQQTGRLGPPNYASDLYFYPRARVGVGAAT